MKQFLHKLWRRDEGVLSFEWVLLVTLVVIGIVGGLAAVRDAVIDELGDVSQAAVNIDQSYDLEGNPELGIPESMYTDEVPLFEDCDRATAPVGQSNNAALILDADS